MNIQLDTDFSIASSEQPYMVFPKVFSDNRGTFSEVLVGDQLDSIQQVNRSTSSQWTIRGCHAQRAPKCQSKLVEALTIPIYDIITDARPDSKSFGLTKIYLLDPALQNRLYVPRGFLHAFAVPPCKDSPNAKACFMYYCDNTYSKADEICINPMSVIPQIANSEIEGPYISSIMSLQNMLQTTNKIVLSEKDTNGLDYQEFMQITLQEYKDDEKLWYIA